MTTCAHTLANKYMFTQHMNAHTCELAHTCNAPHSRPVCTRFVCVCSSMCVLSRACPAGAAKGSAFFKRSTFDVTKVDETFCLQARVPDENETDMVESSDTADASKESTQVFLGEADCFQKKLGMYRECT